MKYIVFYSTKKSEDIVIIKNMFNNCIELNVNWTDFDYNNNIEMIKNSINNTDIENIIFFGLELGWERLVKYIKETYNNIKIKVINNTSEALLYYDYERNNFFKMLELSKLGLIDKIAFLKHGEYELYKSLGYNCFYLMQNYYLENESKLCQQNNGKGTNIGIFPLNYTWDKNVFNQLSIGAFVENSTIFFNNLDERMVDFVNTMNIKNNPVVLDEISENTLLENLKNMDVNISCSFTEYFNPIFFISMELGIPCILGNTSDLFNDNDEIKSYIITKAEDNPIENSKLVIECLNNKNKIIELYKNWKIKYNEQTKLNLKQFLEE